MKKLCELQRCDAVPVKVNIFKVKFTLLSIELAVDRGKLLADDIEIWEGQSQKGKLPLSNIEL